ncbi:hypothetical protein XENOCAPTIV_005255 [Xenoophorus captivus]|uniref:Uncharacterized protein n=1 Tax=Xenoophorus captivus TaxID=1517983 RepID=A0ABV0R700_9TELE
MHTFGIPRTAQLRVALYPAIIDRLTKGCVNFGASENSHNFSPAISENPPDFWMNTLSFVVQGSWLRPTRLMENTRKMYSFPMMRSDTTQCVLL